MQTYDEKYYITTESIAYAENYIYGAGREINSIFEINLENKKMNIITQIPKENLLEERLYNGMSADKKHLLLVPYNAERVWIYEFATEQWESVDISGIVNPKLKGKFVGGEIVEEKAFIFGYNYRGILMINLKTKEVAELFATDDRKKYSFWAQNIVILEDKILAVCLQENKIISINTKNNIYHVFTVKGLEDPLENGNCGLTYDGKDFYIIKHHGNLIYKWNGSNVAMPLAIDSFFNTKNPYFNGIAANNGKIFCYSPKGKSYIYNIKEPRESQFVESPILYAKNIASVGMIICKKGEIVILDENMKEKENVEIYLSEIEHKKYVNKIKKVSGYIKEREIFDIRDYLSVLGKGKK